MVEDDEGCLSRDYFFAFLGAILAMTALYVASIGFVLFLVAAMDHPFKGTVKVEPEAMEMVIHRIEEQRPGSR